MENDRISFDKFWKRVQNHTGLIIVPNAYTRSFFAYTYNPRTEKIEFVSDLKKWGISKTLVRKDFENAWERRGVDAESEEEGLIKAIIRDFIRSS